MFEMSCRKQGEGFTHNPLVISRLCANRRAVKAKNENSLSACASERAYAREGWRKGKRVVARGEKKAVEFSPNVDTFVEKVHRFFSLVERL